MPATHDIDRPGGEGIGKQPLAIPESISPSNAETDRDSGRRQASDE
jgi:hypothetical protein